MNIRMLAFMLSALLLYGKMFSSMPGIASRQNSSTSIDATTNAIAQSPHIPEDIEIAIGRYSRPGYSAKVINYFNENPQHINARLQGLKETPLWFAMLRSASPDFAPLIAFLLERKADVNATTGIGKSLLQEALENNNFPKVAKLLIEHGADRHIRYENGITPLMHAVIEPGRTPTFVMQALLERGDDVNARDNNGSTALMFAASRYNNEEMIRFLIKQKTDIEAKNAQGRTALMKAARSEYAQNVLTLLSFGAHINAQDNEKATAFMHALDHYDLTIAKLLLEHKAHINVQDSNGNTALARVLLSGDNRYSTSTINLVKFLLRMGADKTIENNNKQTALMIANSMKNQQEIIKMLTPLPSNVQRAACGSGEKDGAISKAIIEKFLADGGYIDASNDASQTMLMLACENNSNQDIARLLLENHADVHAKDKYGFTALHVAVRAPAIRTSASGPSVSSSFKHVKRKADEAKLDDDDTRGGKRQKIDDKKLNAQNHTSGLDLQSVSAPNCASLAPRLIAGRSDMVRLLLNNGANKHSRANNGQTPLTLAMVIGNDVVLETLLEGEEPGDRDIEEALKTEPRQNADKIRDVINKFRSNLI